MADSDEQKRADALRRLREMRGKARPANPAPADKGDAATGEARPAAAPGPFAQGGGGLRSRLGQGGGGLGGGGLGGGAGGRMGQGGGAGGGKLRARLAERQAANAAADGGDAPQAGGKAGAGLGGGGLRARLAQGGQGGGGLLSRLGQGGGAGGGLRARLGQGAGGLGGGRVEAATAGSADTVENKHTTRNLLRDRIARLQAQLAALDAELDGVEDATIIEDGAGGKS